MTQRKLTDDELGNVMVARCTLRKIRKPLNKPQCFDLALIYLDCVALHATTDGKPYVEPEPPILDGYRLAVAGDEGRRDCKVWENAWVQRHFVGEQFNKINHYIVPADRVPTDEDAKSRPEVMVRDREEDDWEKQKLVFVNCCADAVRKFVTMDSDDQCAYEWKQCRHLYPGE